ncbi:hypothetical protein [Mycobacterium xenopi]|uniref:Uncharacterized protein n=1 Tax=Mycobacterium xenopi TaxID=1789 RepID=A0AAD1H4X3_MYCXE|nr:hypothetical protein [Mycobacterium xenopi]MDA3639569.1 hypothetical protein [Mycobacterium xenopi]MDA3657806.1 hypothetical protein [Mycobacterium xenopi]MDA3663270.1 hypothetical protein [Mycobacterium xenopi]ORX19281.1 hypothetical protein AWC32_11255 [Mycobacterium xenopi]SPX90267.1 Uncharacterised protein [Mycobacterium xenopi]
MNDELRSAAAPRWRGQPGRLEVWYATLSDPVTRAGLWLHHEIVAPTSGSPYGHGWATWFPADGAPRTERFGPEPVEPVAGPAWFDASRVRAAFEELSGQAGSLTWQLHWKDTGAPLWTFPRLAWERELLPGAQVVLAPTAQFTGSLTVADAGHRLDGWRGGVAHIYGRGNAKRWGWLHADLGDGDVVEVVTAVSHTPGLQRLAPMAFVRFRIDGKDWPASGLPSLRMRTTLGVRHWQLEGRIGRRDVLIRVDQPESRCVSLQYTDPDGATAVCTNTEQADIHVELGDRRWSVLGTGHAEVGLRGAQAPTVNERTPA